ncbi:MAG: hypothetical protein FWH05_06045 [Oscillospiraceae bacterium]|nr:hypothetical protein [Oscillospiraceae bacterium]
MSKVFKPKILIGEKGLIFLVFSISVILHSVYALGMEMISIDPNEFGVAVWVALFNGKDWAGVMSDIPYYYGFVGALLYVPIMWLIPEPFIQYKAMLLLNGIVVSFVPVIAYLLSVRLGVKFGWQRILVAIVCGLYSTIFAHTKFIWNEISCIIFPWLLIFLLVRTCDTKGGTKKHIMSAVTALTAVLAYFAHPRLAVVILSAMIVILFSNFFLKMKLVSGFCFYSTFLIGFFALKMLDTYLIAVMWNGSQALENTLAHFGGQVSGLFAPGGVELFFTTLLGHLYYFSTSTWGLGILSACLAVLVVFRYFQGAAIKKAVFQTGDTDSRRRVVANSGFNNYLLLFSLYALFANIFAGLLSALWKYNDTGYGQYQDTLIFGRYMDSVIPLLIMFVICYAFLYELNLSKLLAATVVSGGIYGLFFIFTASTVASSSAANVLPMLGIYPVRIGEKIGEPVTLDGLFLTVSCVLCFIAVFIVVVCCAQKYRLIILSCIMIAVMLYSSIYTATVYLPYSQIQARIVTAPIYEINRHLYNSSAAPPIYGYKLPARTSTLLQFLNQDTKVYAVNNQTQIPEHCFLIVPTEFLEIFLEEVPGVLKFAQTDDYSVYLRGTRAQAYVRSQAGLEES